MTTPSAPELRSQPVRHSRLTTDLTVLRRPAARVTSRAEAGRVTRALTDALLSINKKAEKANRKDTVLKGVSPPADRGIGLAATQLGIPLRVCVFWNGRFFEPLVNPVILAWTAGVWNPTEGCLSFPGLRVKTARYNAVEVADDQAGKSRWFGRTAEDPTSDRRTACVQHEVAHCFGLTVHDFAGFWAGTPPPFTPSEWEAHALGRPVEPNPFPWEAESP